jgi:hypothetical protein
VISDFERDDLHREVYRTQGKVTSCFGYDAMGRKAWQFASTLPAYRLSQAHNTGINTSLLVNHAYNPIHRRYEYDPADELTRTIDKHTKQKEFPPGLDKEIFLGRIISFSPRIVKCTKILTISRSMSAHPMVRMCWVRV